MGKGTIAFKSIEEFEEDARFILVVGDNDFFIEPFPGINIDIGKENKNITENREFFFIRPIYDSNFEAEGYIFELVGEFEISGYENNLKFSNFDIEEGKREEPLYLIYPEEFQNFTPEIKDYIKEIASNHLLSENSSLYFDFNQEEREYQKSRENSLEMINALQQRVEELQNDLNKVKEKVQDFS